MPTPEIKPSSATARKSVGTKHRKPIAVVSVHSTRDPPTSRAAERSAGIGSSPAARRRRI
jgi:hypothetical protein